MKVLILGSDGMLGSITNSYLLENGYEVFGTSRKKDSKCHYDILENIKKIEEIITQVRPDAIVNCIGILNKVAEDNKAMAALINSYFPHYIDELCIKNGIRFIHISTDCVFDGDKGSYIETDFRDAKSFYGLSKALGEIDNDKNITLRTSIVGPDINSNGIGLFNWFILQQKEVKGFSKAYWSGVTTLELAKVIEKTLTNNVTGLFHITNNEKIDKYNLLKLFKKYMKKDIEIIATDNYVCDKSLVNTRKDYNYEIPSYERMIEEMSEWIFNHRNLYEESILRFLEEK